MHRIAIFSLLGACISPSPAPSATEIQLGGSYQLATRMDLTTAGVLPPLASGTLEALSKLKEDPAGAIISLLQQANVPIVSNVLGVIPDVLKQPLLGWIDTHVFGAIYQGAPVTKQITGIIDDVASLVTAFQLDTQLDVPDPDDLGMTNATHALAGVTFTVAEHSFVVRSPDLLSSVTQAQLQATALHIVEQSPAVENGLLDLDDHAIGLPLGEFVIKGLDQVLMAKFGQPDLRAALGAMIACDALAADIATKCIGPVCVGHEAQIKSLCEAGLDAVATNVESELKKLTFQALHFQNGEAKMWDAAMVGGTQDGVIDRLDDGEWKLGINLGTGDHPVPATFTGVRIVTSTPPVN